MSIQGVFYLIAIILIVIAALPVRVPSVSLALLGAAFALLAFSWPELTGA